MLQVMIKFHKLMHARYGVSAMFRMTLSRCHFLGCLFHLEANRMQFERYEVNMMEIFFYHMILCGHYKHSG